MMIEVNRKVYMDEKTGEKSNSFEKIKDVISALIRFVFIPYVMAKR